MGLTAREPGFDPDVLKYCDGILSGAILSGRYTRLAVERFVNEYTEKQDKEDYKFTFAPSLANEVIGFAESLFIPDIERKLSLLPWMKFVYYNLFGWVHKDDRGKRRFRNAYINVARKNSKTTSILLPIILWDFRATFAAQSFFVSASEAQAAVTFQDLKNIITRSFSVDRRKINMTEREIRKGSSFIRFFGSNTRKVDSFKNSLSVIDEYHDYDSKSKVLSAFQYGARARKNSLNLIITSAGLDISGPCYQEDLKARRILNGVAEDGDSYFTIIYCYDDTDDWKDPANFIKANPSLSVIIQKETLLSDLNDALLTPSHEPDFKAKTCGLWSAGGGVRWIPLETWDAPGQGPAGMEEFEGQPCWGGLDLSSINDFTAYTLVFRKDDRFYFKHRFYIPEDTIYKRYQKENINIPAWVNAGVITAIPGPVIDYSFIYQDIKNDQRLYKITEITYDSWNSFELIKMLEDDSFSSNLVLTAYTQNLKSLSQPTKTYEKLVYEKRIIDPNPVMQWMIGCTVVKPDANGNYRPLKDGYNSGNSTKRIDGVITSIIALDRCLAYEGDGLSFEDLMSLI
jgi:phage terminase large subunit-like protein